MNQALPEVYSSFSLVESSSSEDEAVPEDAPLSLSPSSLPSLPTLLESLDVGEVDTELSPAEFIPGSTPLPARL